jgi:hypothetical protein
LPAFPSASASSARSRYGLINRRHTLNKALLPQMAERFAQLAESPGAPLPRPLPLPTTDFEQRTARATLAALGIELPEKLAVFCPGAEYGPAKRWPARHFATWPMRWPTRLRRLAARLGQGPAIGDEIVARAPASLPLNLCGTTSLTPGHRPAGGGLLRRLQRFRPDARRRRPRPAADRRLWLVVARLHAAALGAGAGHQPRARMQPLLQARMPARPSRLPQQARPAARARRLPVQEPGMIVVFATPEDVEAAFYEAIARADLVP